MRPDLVLPAKSDTEALENRLVSGFFVSCDIIVIFESRLLLEGTCVCCERLF